VLHRALRLGQVQPLQRLREDAVPLWIVFSRTTHLERAGIVLASADRHSAQQVEQRVGSAGRRVWRWQQRSAETKVEVLLRDKTQAGQGAVGGGNHRAGWWNRRAPSRRTKRIIGPAGQWPRRSASRWVRCGASGGRTNCSRTGFAKLTNIVGLYVDPPAHAVVLSIDEES
jgi:hypothetical protein